MFDVSYISIFNFIYAINFILCLAKYFPQSRTTHAESVGHFN